MRPSNCFTAVSSGWTVATPSFHPTTKASVKVKTKTRFFIAVPLKRPAPSIVRRGLTSGARRGLTSSHKRRVGENRHDVRQWNLSSEMSRESPDMASKFALLGPGVADAGGSGRKSSAARSRWRRYGRIITKTCLPFAAEALHFGLWHKATARQVAIMPATCFCRSLSNDRAFDTIFVVVRDLINIKITCSFKHSGDS